MRISTVIRLKPRNADRRDAATSAFSLNVPAGGAVPAIAVASFKAAPGRANRIGEAWARAMHAFDDDAAWAAMREVSRDLAPAGDVEGFARAVEALAFAGA